MKRMIASSMLWAAVLLARAQEKAAGEPVAEALRRRILGFAKLSVVSILLGFLGLGGQQASADEQQLSVEEQERVADLSRNQGRGQWRYGVEQDDFEGEIRWAELIGSLLHSDWPHPAGVWIGVIQANGGDPYVNMSLGTGHICAFEDTIKGDAIIDGDEREKITFGVSKNKEFLHVRAAAYWIEKFNRNENLKVRLIDDCGAEQRVEFNIQGQTGFGT